MDNIATLNTLTGYVETYTDNKFTLVVLNGTRYQFTIDTNTALFINPLEVNDVVTVLFENPYAVDTPAIRIDEVPLAVMGTFENITDHYIELTGTDGEHYIFTVDANTSYVGYEPAIGDLVIVKYTIADDATIADIIQTATDTLEGNNQVGGAPTHISEAEFPLLKKEGEYVYPSDWNALVRAVKVLNDNAVLLAELVAKHNSLDADTLSVAQATILDNSVTTQHLANNSVTGSKIPAKALTTEHYADKSITVDKLSGTLLGALLSDQLKEVIPTATYSSANGTVLNPNDDVQQVEVRVPLVGNSKVIIAVVSGTLYVFFTDRPYECLYAGNYKESDGDLHPIVDFYSCAVGQTGVITKFFQGYNSWSGWYLKHPNLTSQKGKTGLIGCYVTTTNAQQELVFVFEQRLYNDAYQASEFTIRAFGC